MTEQQDSTPGPQAEFDAELVRAHLAGDRTALGSIYDRYGQSLFDTAAAMTGNRDDAADMTQDVFVLAAERLGQLRDATRLKPWLFAILRNEVYRRSRRRAKTVVTDFSAPERDVVLPPTSSGTDAVDDEIDYEDVAELVRGAARGLDARDQLVLELSVRQGLSGADLADALGVSAQQSYGLVHRMRERTERSLSAYCVARKGRNECADLDAILNGWDGDFTVLLRKRVARHIEDCTTCERTRRRFAPIALVGAAPAFAAPIELRDRILTTLDQLHPDGVAQSTSAEFSSSTGFPVLTGVARSGRRLAMLLSGAAAAVLVGAGIFTIAKNDESTTAATTPPPSITVSQVEGDEPEMLVVANSTSTIAISPSTIATLPPEDQSQPTTAVSPATTTPEPPAPPSTNPATTSSVTVQVGVGDDPGTPSTSQLPTTTSSTTTSTSSTTSTSTTLAPAAPLILDARSGGPVVLLPSECDTDIYVTVDIEDPNGEPMFLQVNWAAPGVNAPSSGSVSESDLSDGSHRLLLGSFDYRYRGVTLFVTMSVSDPSNMVAERGFQIGTNSGGECPNTFG